MSPAIVRSLSAANSGGEGQGSSIFCRQGRSSRRETDRRRFQKEVA
jgi:hypothetical protein